MLGYRIQLCKASVQLGPYGELFPRLSQGKELIDQGDPHGAAFWLDFLAIKSGNYAWIISMFEEHSEQFPVAVFQGYPGMAFAYALACRAREDAEKDKVRYVVWFCLAIWLTIQDRTRSNDALREAILAFPQAVIPLADKIGAEVPASARTHPLMQVQAGYR